MGISVGGKRYGGGRSLDQIRWEEERRKKNVFCIAALVFVFIILGAVVAAFAGTAPERIGIGAEIVLIERKDPLYRIGYFRVARVRPNSPADFAGLRKDDVIEYLDEMMLTEKTELWSVTFYIEQGSPESKILVGIRRLVKGKNYWTFVSVRREKLRNFKGY